MVPFLYKMYLFAFSLALFTTAFEKNRTTLFVLTAFFNRVFKNNLYKEKHGIKFVYAHYVLLLWPQAFL